jgi:hypothetical protein
LITRKATGEARYRESHPARRGQRPWHVRTLFAREPGGLGFGRRVDAAGPAVYFGAVIREIDIWRAAQLMLKRLMLKRYGERALEESAARADELASAGDHNGAATWRRIMMGPVTQLANQHPARPGPLTGISLRDNREVSKRSRGTTVAAGIANAISLKLSASRLRLQLLAHLAESTGLKSSSDPCMDRSRGRQTERDHAPTRVANDGTCAQHDGACEKR